ncbi:hypothetical protein HY212_07510 [Candidatus Pacearchaeota archaeon]|nr:hypothetical protein [Candidatus Pacearchaeota archaeon]
MGLLKRGLSLNLTLVVSFIIILGLASFVFAAIAKYIPVSVAPPTENPVKTQTPEPSIIGGDYSPLTTTSIEIIASNGCNIADAECGSVPTDNCDVRQNTTFTPGTYNLPNGIDVCANEIVLDCNGSTIISVNYPINIYLINGSTIKNCNLTNNGIDLLASNFNVIANNSGNIRIRDSNYNIIKSNNFVGSAETQLDDSDYNILESNIANFHNGNGIFLTSCELPMG